MPIIRVAMLWLVNEGGEVLLVRRADNMDTDHGLWGPSLTGTVESGESFEQALDREADEELSLKPNKYSPSLLFETKFLHPDGRTIHFKVFAAVIPKSSSKEFVIDKNEVAEIKWLPVEYLKELIKNSPEKVVVSAATTLWKQIFDGLDKYTIDLGTGGEA